VEEPVTVAETPVVDEVAPVEEAVVKTHKIWPWALGALALAGLATALALPHHTTQVAEPAPVSPVAHVVETATPTLTPTTKPAPSETATATAAPAVVSLAKPTCDGGEFVLAKDTDLRKEALESDVLKKLTSGTVVDITGDSYVDVTSGTGRIDWFPVTVDGVSGYVNSADVQCRITTTG